MLYDYHNYDGIIFYNLVNESMLRLSCAAVAVEQRYARAEDSTIGDIDGQNRSRAHLLTRCIINQSFDKMPVTHPDTSESSGYRRPTSSCGIMMIHSTLH